MSEDDKKEVLARTCRNLVMEINAYGLTKFVNGSTGAECRLRADSLYGKGKYKEIVIKTSRETLNVV